MAVETRKIVLQDREIVREGQDPVEEQAGLERKIVRRRATGGAPRRGGAGGGMFVDVCTVVIVYHGAGSLCECRIGHAAVGCTYGLARGLGRSGVGRRCVWGSACYGRAVLSREVLEPGARVRGRSQGHILRVGTRRRLWVLVCVW